MVCTKEGVAMKKVLLTAFEAFGEDALNPTELILKELPDQLANAVIMKVTLPVVYREAFETLKPLIDKHQPDLIMMLGLAGGRAKLSLERIAINLNDASLPDNRGNILKEEVIKQAGKDGIFSNLPLQSLLDALHQVKVPSVISNTAGTYVCNDTMYRVLHYIKSKQLKALAGFVHVPYMPEQVLNKQAPSMELELMVKGVRVIIERLFDGRGYDD